MVEEGPAPLLAWHHEVKIRLEDCQKFAVRSPRSFVQALRSLHRILIHPTMLSLLPEREASLDEKVIPGGRPEKLHPVKIPDFSTAADSSARQDILRNIAEKLIGLERVIFSVDDEVNGASSSFSFDYKDDCEWYNDTLNKSVRSPKAECNARQKSVDCSASELICNDTERCIDACLDACGHTLSLDAAVDCLRQIAHESSLAASNLHTVIKSLQERKKNKGIGFVAVVTSLRTVRRRLLLLPASKNEAGFNTTSFPKPYKDTISSLRDELDDQDMRVFECIILPLENYYNKRINQYSKTRHDQQQHHHAQPQAQQTQLLSDTLPSLAISVLPTLISAACYAVDLPLPLWATPKISHVLLFHCAWKILLAGELIGEFCTASSARDGKDLPSDAAFATDNTNSSNATNHLVVNHQPPISVIASDHFQSLVRQMIESGRSDIIAHQLYKCWKSVSNHPSSTHPQKLATPRSILCRQLTAILGSVLPSRRKVAVFCREIILDCAKHVIPRSEIDGRLKQHTRNQLDGVCQVGMLPFLREVVSPSLAKDAELVDAMVQFIILSPPTSYQIESRLSAYPTLQATDRAVPRCLAQLLALTCDSESQVNEAKLFQDESDSDESDANSLRSFVEVNGFLKNLYAAANVWCEDVFVTRTDTLQQQYVTEFLLQPLECKQLTKDDLQTRLSDDGTSLAVVLIQGVSLRLDVSRSESVRIDGMLVAEALAALLGQTLRFDELHPSCEENAGITVEEIKEIETKKVEKRRHRKKRVLEPRVLDPDALISYDSDSSSSQNDSSKNSYDSSNESYDSVSSWGEDSLEPYAMDDDEEDLSRVPCPRTLRGCLAYLTISETDPLAYDKHHAALTELEPIIDAQPLDLHDVMPTLVRILLFLEDKFSMDQFAVKRWDTLMALGVNSPTEMCLILVGEMRRNISLCTRLEALSLLKGIAQDLSSNRRAKDQRLNSSDHEISYCSSKLLRALNLNDASNGGEDVTSEPAVQYSKTRRWRKHRTPTSSTPNRFGVVSVQMIYSLFSFLSQTRTDESIWGGSIGEKFLSEFLKTLAIMLYCASTYPSSALLVFASDLFDLAWSFHTAKCSEVRHAALMAMLTCMSLLPLESIIHRAHRTGSFLRQCSKFDESSDCRHVASLILGTVSEVMNQNLGSSDT